MIALGCDQAGYELKQEIIKYLEEKGLEYKDYGSYSADPVDYPIYGRIVAKAVAGGECDKGILICGNKNRRSHPPPKNFLSVTG